MAAIWESLKRFWDTQQRDEQLPQLQTPQPGSKRKASGDSKSSEARLRRRLGYTPDFYEGYARDLHRAASGTPTPRPAHKSASLVSPIRTTMGHSARPRLVAGGFRTAGQHTDALNDSIEQSPCPDKCSVKRPVEPLDFLHNHVVRGPAHRLGAGSPKPRALSTTRKRTLADWHSHMSTDDDARTYEGDYANVKEAMLDGLYLGSVLRKPQYVVRNIEVRDSYSQVNDQMSDFTWYHEHPKREPLAVDRKILQANLKKMDVQTVKIIDSVASGGPTGVDGWLDLFIDGRKRAALIVAIMGNVLSEQVYQHDFFGCSAEDIAALDRIQRRHRDSDGFTRNTLFANYISKSLGGRAHDVSHISLPPGFHAHVLRVVGAIETHLCHIPRPRMDAAASPMRVEYVESLYEIVAQAGIVSIMMRLDPHTIYYTTPAHVGERTKASDVVYFNESEMTASRAVPSKTKFHSQGEGKDKQAAPTALSNVEVQPGEKLQSSIQIVLMNGLTAYRKGGWETRDSTVWKPVYEAGMEDKGIRMWRLNEPWVYGRWASIREGKEKANGKGSEESEVEFRDVLFGDAK